jgi:hypothetical protein
VPPEFLGSIDEPLDFCRGQELPAPPLGIGHSTGRFG